MNVFIVGPMTGYPEFNFPKFKEVEDRLFDKGFRVKSMRQMVDHVFGGDTTRPAAEYMAQAIPALIGADAICPIDGWKNSNNARCEVGIALVLGLLFVSEDGEIIPPPDFVTVMKPS